MVKHHATCTCTYPWWNLSVAPTHLGHRIFQLLILYGDSLTLLWNYPSKVKLISLISTDIMDISIQAPRSLTSKIHGGPLKIATGESAGLVKILYSVAKIYTIKMSLLTDYCLTVTTEFFNTVVTKCTYIVFCFCSHNIHHI